MRKISCAFFLLATVALVGCAKPVMDREDYNGLCRVYSTATFPFCPRFYKALKQDFASRDECMRAVHQTYGMLRPKPQPSKSGYRLDKARTLAEEYCRQNHPE